MNTDQALYSFCHIHCFKFENNKNYYLNICTYGLNVRNLTDMRDFIHGVAQEKHLIGTDMCNVKLPIPDIKIQEAIVTIYHTLETRKRINEKLKNTIKPLCPVLMRGVIQNYENDLVTN